MVSKHKLHKIHTKAESRAAGMMESGAEHAAELAIGSGFDVTLCKCKWQPMPKDVLLSPASVPLQDGVSEQALYPPQENERLKEEFRILKGRCSSIEARIRAGSWSECSISRVCRDDVRFHHQVLRRKLQHLNAMLCLP